MQTIVFRLEGLACPECARNTGMILERQKGVKKAVVTFATGKVKVEYDPAVITPGEIEQVIAKTGYRITGRG
ncbi:heavy-metal-associated domain-containing protein [Desulfofundulus sp. TPOSR]|jgi:copper chaperone CopZ|uniref:Heavy metal transport/detoxification protein n=1 Tax=Desulfofundulus kuznetsovii (strain DSM 6115 / VKM B-1805 / 17) TaxID=760568 RepID=A0AAU8Q0Z6_DESK7|nr:heavy metal-associated domain-containing protein [Desulfofundulus sp. TPOSR]AEG16283.1 Heavy metal transport/detoxification protein [Desulfofundulus kuznetsovii DSM 6115]MDK2887400.1 copper chaperone [Thermoanaerobacter sp.]NHM27214.1 heavy-metal-associated domain-containing protein [Desulfofundulus sp. TPOSR]